MNETERLSALLNEPEARSSPGMRATLDAWIAASTPEPPDDTHLFPIWAYDDPRTGRLYTWGVTGLRPNGLTGWWLDGTKPGSWRIDHHGRVHRGLPWQRQRSRVVATRLEEATRLLHASAPFLDEGLRSEIEAFLRG